MNEHNNIVVLRGRISGLKVEKTTVDAFQGDALRTRTGAAGALAAAAGLSGIAAGLVATSMDEMREAASGVSFQIDGSPVRGVLWDCPFKEGDEVEVVAERLEDHWNAFAVARPIDQTIALFPHVVSGEVAHYKTSLLVFTKIVLGIMIFGCVMFGAIEILSSNRNVGTWLFLALGGTGVASFVLAVIGLNTARKYLPFVRIAEAVFTALGWKDVKRINLRKRTFKQIKPEDDAALGVFHFRY